MDNWQLFAGVLKKGCHSERPEGVEESTHYRFCGAKIRCEDPSTSRFQRFAQDDRLFWGAVGVVEEDCHTSVRYSSQWQGWGENEELTMDNWQLLYRDAMIQICPQSGHNNSQFSIFNCQLSIINPSSAPCGGTFPQGKALWGAVGDNPPVTAQRWQSPLHKGAFGGGVEKWGSFAHFIHRVFHKGRYIMNLIFFLFILIYIFLYIFLMLCLLLKLCLYLRLILVVTKWLPAKPGKPAGENGLWWVGRGKNRQNWRFSF